MERTYAFFHALGLYGKVDNPHQNEMYSDDNKPLHYVKYNVH